MLAWLGGIALQLQQAALWPTAVNVACVAAGAMGVAATLRRPRGWVSAGVLCAAIATAAFGIAAWRAEARLAERLSPALEGRDLLITGVVDRMPLLASDGYRFVFAAEAAEVDGRAVAMPPLLALSWSRGGDEGVLAAPTVDLRAGQRWQFPVRLRRPHAALNPQGFDGELWFFEQGLGATGTVRSAVAGPQPRQLADTGSRPIEHARQTVRDALLLRVGDARVAGVLAALAVGDQAAIARSDWDLFREAGGGSPDEHQRLARHALRVACRRTGGVAVAAQRAPACGCRHRRQDPSADWRWRRCMRWSPASACRRSARC